MQPGQQAVEQHDVAAAAQRQVQVRLFRRGCAARIDDHQLHARPPLALGQDALHQHRMAPGQVGADQHDEIGSLQVRVVDGNDVFAECTHVTGNGRGHAQAGIGIDVRRADVALHQLVGDVVVLGEQLARDIQGHGLRARARRCRRTVAMPPPTAPGSSPPCDRQPRGAAGDLRGRAFAPAPCLSNTVGRDWRDAPDRHAR